MKFYNFNRIVTVFAMIFAVWGLIIQDIYMLLFGIGSVIALINWEILIIMSKKFEK